jgi:DNA-binding MarR family transcriptional regulator
MRVAGERAQDREQAVLDFIRDNPETTGQAAAEAIGVPSATATKSINQMIEDGRLEATGQRRARKLSTA